LLATTLGIAMLIYLGKSRGQLLRKARLEKGLTQKELGKKVGVSESYISLLERGIRERCPPELLKDIAKALEPEVNSILTASSVSEESVSLIKAKAAASNRFGTLLHDFRTREGLSIRKVASILQVNEQDIFRLEACTRKLPSDPEFYARLRSIPGFTNEDVVDLLHTEDAPRWFIKPQDRTNPKPVTSEPQEVAVAGIKVTFTLQTDESRLSPEKIEYLAEMIRRDSELCIRDFIDAKRGKVIKGELV
jgi:transcriptional regulator with XRE-family HTH domain